MSAIENAPAAASAEYSPSEWPATNGRVPRDGEAGFGFEHAQRRERHRHQGRLRIVGQRQRLRRPFPASLR